MPRPKNFYEQALTNDPTQPTLWLGSPAGLGQNKWDEAIARIQAQIPKFQPCNSIIAGRCLSDKKNYAGAETAIKKSIELRQNQLRCPAEARQCRSPPVTPTRRSPPTAVNSEQTHRCRSMFCWGRCTKSKQPISASQTDVSESLQLQPDNALAKNKTWLTGCSRRRTSIWLLPWPSKPVACGTLPTPPTRWAGALL